MNEAPEATDYELELHAVVQRGKQAMSMEELESWKGEMVACAAVRAVDGENVWITFLEGVLVGVMRHGYGWERTGYATVEILGVGAVRGKTDRTRNIMLWGNGIEIFKSLSALPWWAVAGGRPPEVGA